MQSHPPVQLPVLRRSASSATGTRRAPASAGIDLRGQESKTLDRFLGEPFDLVVTVSDEARDSCPVFPGARRREHRSFEDPSAAGGAEEERLAVFRRVRDGLANRVRALAASG